MTRPELAESLFRSGYNCAQSVVMAFAPDFGLSREEAERISAAFGAPIVTTPDSPRASESETIPARVPFMKEYHAAEPRSPRSSSFPRSLSLKI